MSGCAAQDRLVVVSPSLVASVVPLLWMVSTSLKSNREITQDGTLVPHSLDLRQLRAACSTAATSAPT